MKKLLLFSLLIIFAGEAFAQKQTFDLITFTPPQGWTKNLEETVLSYTITDNKSNTWCRILIIKSTISKGTIEADFESEWQKLIIKNYNPKEKRADTEVQVSEGWKIKAGSSKFTFDKSESMAMLTTASGYNRCVSIVAVTNNQNYLKDVEALIASVELIKPEIASSPTAIANDAENSIVGTWIISTSDQSSYAVNNGINGYTIRQYTFNTDGTYTFFIKSFQYTFDKLLLTRESGTYQIIGNNITVNPKRSLIEAWSKKDNADKWGKLLSSQNRQLEKVTYSFTKHYFSGVQEWNLVLQANKQTQRDGPFNGGSAFDSAWLYGTGKYPIELPK
jgi:hypothetical protein